MSHDRRAAALTRTTWCAVWAAIAWITAAAAHLTDTPGYWFLAGLPFALVLAVVDVHMGLASDTRGAYVTWRAVFVAAWSVWTATGTGYTPWDSTVAICWLVLLVASIAVIPWVATKPADGENLIGQVWGGKRAEWRDRIKRIAKLDVETLDVTRWDSRLGFTVAGEFGAGGANWEDLAAKTSRFASDLRLPDGCAVEIGMGPHQAAFTINYATKNAFTVTDDEETDGEPMPDPTPGSIHDACPIGQLADGSTAQISDLRQESIALGGAIGSGKSNAMRVIGCWHVTRRDQVTYVIDLSAGRLGRPFMKPYLEGKVDRPAIDGLADTPERAEALLTWLLDVVDDRPITYGHLMDDADDDKLPVSAQVPAIRLIVDEPKKIWGNPRLGHLALKLTEGTETGRAMAMRPDYTALGGTVDALPGNLKRQVRVRIALRCADAAEIGYFLDWVAARMLNLRALARRGMAYIGALNGPTPRLMRFWRVKPSKIEQVAIAAAAIRPDIDEAAKRLPSYQAVADRWEWQRRPQAPAPTPKETPVATVPATPQPDPDPVAELQASVAGLGDVHAKLKARRLELEAQQAGTAVAVATRPDIAADVHTYLAGRGDTSTDDLVKHLQAAGHPQADNRLREIISGLAAAGTITRVKHGVYRANQ